MPSWKKMKKKLTHMFSDHHSTSSSTAPSPAPSSLSSSSATSPLSTSSDHDQARSPFNKDESSYVSSVLSYLFPSNESILKKDEDDFIEPSQSLKNIRCGKQIINKEDNEELQTARGTSCCDVFEDAIDLQTPMKYIPDQNLDSVFITSELYRFFQSCLPNIVKGCQWVLLYSTVKHGISLRTLIRNSCDLPGPCLLITGDTKGAVFGGLINSPLTPTPQRKYQGTVQTFIFTTLYGPPTLFRPTGANRYFYMCLNDMLAFGGGSFALRLDGELLMGTSGPSETFGNERLAHNEDFEIKNVELWGFTHSSRYHS